MGGEGDTDIEHPLGLEEATQIIRCYAESEQTTRVICGHAKERMRERELNPQWVDKVLKIGEVIERRFESNSWRYKVSHTDRYGSTYVVTAIPRKNKLVIITVMRSD